MARFPLLLLVGLTVSAVLTGCTCCRQHDTPLPEFPDAPLPKVQRPAMVTLLQESVGPITFNPLELPHEYRGLTDQQCRCMSAKAQENANSLDAEADELDQQLARQCLPPTHEKVREVALKQYILRSHAMEFRSANAGVGLNLFLQIAEIEALTDLQRESLHFLGEGLEHMRGLKDAGLKSNEDFAALHRQYVEAQTDLTKLQLTVDELNNGLHRLLELPGSCDCYRRFWPLFKLHQAAAIPDCEAAVKEGMERRPELLMLRRILVDLDARTLATVQKELSNISPMLGMASAKTILTWVMKMAAILCDAGPLAREVEVRRKQVAEQLASRMLVISGEIRQDLKSMCHRTQIIAETRLRVQILQANLEDLRGKKAKGIASFAQVMEAELHVLKARSDLVKEVNAWEREWVQLGFHQGVLAYDCPPEQDKGCCSAKNVAPGPADAIKHDFPQVNSVAQPDHVEKVELTTSGLTGIAYFDPDKHGSQTKELQTPKDVELSYEYDTKGRLATITCAGKYVLQYTYDDKDRVVGVKQVLLKNP